MAIMLIQEQTIDSNNKSMHCCNEKRAKWLENKVQWVFDEKASFRPGIKPALTMSKFGFI